jgi:hypothetical protein
MVTWLLLRLIEELHPRRSDAGLVMTLAVRFLCGILVAMAIWPN